MDFPRTRCEDSKDILALFVSNRSKRLIWKRISIKWLIEKRKSRAFKVSGRRKECRRERGSQSEWTGRKYREIRNSPMLSGSGGGGEG